VLQEGQKGKVEVEGQVLKLLYLWFDVFLHPARGARDFWTPRRDPISPLSDC
jgi:hypothetical protein